MNFEIIDLKYFKLSIYMLLTLTVVLCLYDNKTEVMEALGKNNSDTLPIFSVETNNKVVSLTFDSTYGDEDIDEILNILDNHNCKSTFFVSGDWALNYPDAVKKISNYGHDLGNHTANYKHMTKLSNKEMLQEITECHDIIKGLTNQEMTLFRAPYGDYSEKVILAADTANYYTVQWNIDSYDWKDYGSDSIVKTVCESKDLSNGSIILLHNGSKYTASALDLMLTTLEDKGYSFVPVSELIYYKNYYIDGKGRQFSN